MTFDTAELKGRAELLKSKAIEMQRKMTPPAGTTGRGAAAPPPQQGPDPIDAMFDGVENIYDDFLVCPKPEDFAAACDQLATVMGTLSVEGYEKDPTTGGGDQTGTANSALSGVDSSGDYMADWTGDAASTYKLNYADKFNGVASNQFVLASVIRNAINAEAAIWQAVADDLDKLSADAESKMEQCDDRSPSDWAAELSILGAVVGVLAVPITGGTSLELTIAAVGAGISVASTGIGAMGGGEKDEFGLETGSPKTIISSLEEALSKIRTHISDSEQRINDTMIKTQTAVANNWADFCIPRPQFANAQSSSYDDPTYAGESNG